MTHRGFWQELKRRHVYRVAAAYAIVGWLLIQVVTQVFPIFHLPDWIDQAIVLLILIGFPIALVLAWAFDATPHGIVLADATIDGGAAGGPMSHRSHHTGVVVGLVGVLIAIGAGAAWWHFQRDGTTAALSAAAASAATLPTTGAPTSRAIPASPINAQPIPAKSIAVLPFENLSTDKGNAYFADGMQDLILTKLADIGDLKVISRTSTMQYGSHPQNLKVIAQQLGVATVLEGSVQKAGNQVLINVQLINAQTDSHLWAESYQRTLDNIFGVEGEVAQKVADALNARLTPAETVRAGDKPTQNPAAYDLFLRAEYLFNKARVSLDTAAMKPAIDLYQQAVAKDPGFALAWARLSYAQSSLRWFGGAGIDIRQLGNAARVNAQRALILQPDLADANLAMGYSDYWGRRDYAAALKAFAAAQRARPNDTEAITASAYVLRRQGDYAAAIGRQQAALSLDPRNTELASNLAITYMYSRRYADAEAAFQRALALDPDNLDAKVEYAQTIVLGSGDVPRALAQVQGDAPLLKLQRAWLLTLQRKYREAIDVTGSFADTPDNYGLTHQTGPRALTLGDLYLRAGDTTHAHALLLQARQQIQAQLDEQSYNPVRLPIAWSFLADAELGLGNTNAALRAIRKSLELTIASHDHTDGPAQLGVNAGLYARIGRADLAVPLLEEVLASPDGGGDISPVMLQLDPTYDPIRDDLRFQALLKKYASAAPSASGALIEQGTRP